MGRPSAAASDAAVYLKDNWIGEFHLNNTIQLPDPPAIYVGVPPMPNYFVGREALVERIVHRLISEQPPALAVEGLPGVGKTTLAVALAHHPAIIKFFEDGILWASMGNRPYVMNSLATWADAFDEDLSNVGNAGERARIINSLIGDRRMLLIIDDVWDSDVAKVMRCGGHNCSHFLTTRDKAIARDFAGKDQVENIPVLDDASAYELLRALASEVCTASPSETRELLDAVGGLPLAVDLLGGYLAAPQHSYFPELQMEALEDLADPKHRLQLAKQRMESFQSSKITLEETILLSLESLPEQAQQAFHALGAFAAKPKQFDLKAAESVADTDSMTLAFLVARNLVEIIEGGGLAIHRTLADVARTRLDDGAIRRHREYYLALVNKDREDWRTIEKIYAQIKRAVTNMGDDDEELLRVADALNIYQKRRGLWRDKLDWAQDSLRMVKEKGKVREHAEVLRSVGSLHHDLGEVEESLVFLKEALAIWKELGAQNEVAATLDAIGLVHHDMGERREALRYYEEALTIRHATGDRSGLGSTLDKIGMAHYALGDQTRAFDYFQQTLAIHMELGQRFETAVTLNNIGMVYYALGDYPEARTYYKRSLAIHEDAGNRAGQAIAFNNIAMAHSMQSKWEKALEFYGKALPILEEINDRRTMSSTLNNIGMAYHAMEKLDEALKYYQRALLIRKETGNRPGLAGTLNNIGLVHNLRRQYDDALECVQQALVIYQEIGNRTGYARALSNIGTVYRYSGKLDQARDTYLEALPIQEETKDQKGLASTLYYLGLIYLELRQHAEALNYLRRALLVQEEIKDVAGERTTRYSMVEAYCGENQIREAMEELRRVIQFDESENHPDLAAHTEMMKELEAELEKRSASLSD